MNMIARKNKKEETNVGNSRFKKTITKNIITSIFIIAGTVSAHANDSSQLSQSGDSRIQSSEDDGVSGFTPMNDIGSTIYVDNNGNGRQDSDEPGIPNLNVQLLNSQNEEIKTGPDGILGNGDDLTGRVKTDNNGSYQFYNLPPDRYKTIVTSE